MDHLLVVELGDLLTASQVLVQQVVAAEGLVHQDVCEGVLGLHEVVLRGLHALPARPQAHLRWEACPGTLALLRLGPRIHDLPDRLWLWMLLCRDGLVLVTLRLICFR